MSFVPKLTIAASITSLLLLASSSAFGATATINLAEKHQTIEGFGFFGAHNVWWGSADDMLDEEWVDLVINDLGVSMWRNELYPPSDALNQQDADWAKQLPVVRAFRDKAAAAQVPLKMIVTVWTPPASLKCAESSGVISDGVPHPQGTKNGGSLCPSKRDEFAQWLVDGVQAYKDEGIDVYALSFQNEPYFRQSYNSCFYSQQAYVDTLKAIGPTVKSAFPNLKLFGAENMLAIECGKNGDEFDPWWYTANQLQDPEAMAQLDAWAVHGYNDGVLATEASRMSVLWRCYYEGTKSSGLPIWMTETSGYEDSMEGVDDTPGAFDLAQSIYASLYYGRASAWVWWQGSELGNDAPSEYALMSGTTKRGKKYHVSKNYYRFIRPGARMVSASSDDPEVLVAAFQHEAMGAVTVVVLNGGQQEKTLSLNGAGLPSSFVAHRTSSTDDCAEVGEVSAGTITLPARSVTTLVHGNVYEHQAPLGGGTGGGGNGAGGEGAGGDGAGAAPTAGDGNAGGGVTSGDGVLRDDPAEDSGCACRASGLVSHQRLPWRGLLVMGSAVFLACARRKSSLSSTTPRA